MIFDVFRIFQQHFS